MTWAIEADEVELRFGERVALAPSSFRVPASRVSAVIGPNGSGKTTLLHAVSSLRRPASGRLTVLGGDPALVRRRVSYVLQASRVNETMPVTVREVVAMGRYATRGPFRPLGREDHDRVEEALARMDLSGIAGRHLTELSGGQRQRVFVAQGLAQDHDLLLLDEPLTGLDLVSAETIDAVVHEEQAAGRTVLFTTHDLGEARAADHVLLLAGRVVASGTPETVLTPENLVAAYGTHVLHPEAGLVIDDPAHRPAQVRHVHMERGPGQDRGR